MRNYELEEEIKESEKNNRELHIPGYNFCGPGTKIGTRIFRGDKGNILYNI